MRLIGVWVLVWTAGAVWAQEPHQYTPADIDQGGRLFGQNCTGCHGPDGNRVAGIDLGRLKLRRPMSDDELVHVIRTGISGTAMPAFNNLSDGQAGMIVGYLHSLAAEPPSEAFAGGDPARGKMLYEGKGQCQKCHRIHGAGGRVGPDLTEIGSLRRAAQLEKSIVDPSAEIAANNRPFRVVTKEGETINGKLLNLDTFSVQMLDTHENLRSFEKSDLNEYVFLDKSPMPSYQGRLSAQEIADIVSYLTTLKGSAPSAAQVRPGR